MTYFIKTIAIETLKYNEIETANSSLVYSHLYKFLIKKGANYLRHDSLQVLVTEIGKNSFENNENNEGNVNIEEFIFKILKEKRLS